MPRDRTIGAPASPSTAALELAQALVDLLRLPGRDPFLRELVGIVLAIPDRAIVEDLRLIDNGLVRAAALNYLLRRTVGIAREHQLESAHLERLVNRDELAMSLEVRSRSRPSSVVIQRFHSTPEAA